MIVIPGRAGDVIKHHEAVLCLEKVPALARLCHLAPHEAYVDLGHQLVLLQVVDCTEEERFASREHWIVVEGTAKVTIDDEVKLVSEGQSVYVPLGSIHRMENPGKLPMLLIEVQIGTYLGEDDIKRYEDIYGR